MAGGFVKSERVLVEAPQHLRRGPELLLIVLNLSGLDEGFQKCDNKNLFTIFVAVAVPIPVRTRRRSACEACGPGPATCLALLTLRRVLPLRSVSVNST